MLQKLIQLANTYILNIFSKRREQKNTLSTKSLINSAYANFFFKISSGSLVDESKQIYEVSASKSLLLIKGKNTNKYAFVQLN